VHYLDVYSLLKDQKMHVGIMNAILLYGDQLHISATRVAIFWVVSARIKLYLLCVRITPHSKVKSIDFYLIPVE